MRDGLFRHVGYAVSAARPSEMLSVGQNRFAPRQIHPVSSPKDLVAHAIGDKNGSWLAEMDDPRPLRVKSRIVFCRDWIVCQRLLQFGRGMRPARDDRIRKQDEAGFNGIA